MRMEAAGICEDRTRIYAVLWFLSFPRVFTIKDFIIIKSSDDVLLVYSYVFGYLPEPVKAHRD